MNETAIYPALATLAILFLCFIYFRKKRISKQKTTVLLYHNIDLAEKNSNMITVEQFEKQIDYLIKNNYNFISLKQLLTCMEAGEALPPKPVLITFDDCYKEVFRLAVPILAKNNIKATFFIPTQFVNDEENKHAGTMSYHDLKEMVKQGNELALHSHSHNDFNTISPEEIRQDLILNIKHFHHHNIPFQPVLAYPYGSRPSNKEHYKKMLDEFSDLGIKAAFRVGNRINRVPFKNKFEINRLDIKGSESFEKFKLKLRFGKTKF